MKNGLIKNHWKWLMMIVLIAFLLLFFPYWPIVRVMYLEYRASQGPSSLPTLISALNDNNELSSRVAVGKVVSFGRLSVLDLSGVLSNREQSGLKRARAAECLGLIGMQTKDVLSALHVGSSDECEYVRAQSLRALWRLQKNADEVVPGLITLLRSSEYKVVYVTIETLDEIGPPAQSAVRPLIELRDSNSLFGSNASDAIRSIRAR